MLRYKSNKMEEKVKEMLISGISVPAISKALGVKDQRIRYIARAEGIKITKAIPPKGDQRQKRKGVEKPIPDWKRGKKIEIENLDRLVKAGLTAKEIAKILEVSVGTIYGYACKRKMTITKEDRVMVKNKAKIMKLLDEGRGPKEIAEVLKLNYRSLHTFLYEERQKRK